MCKMSRCLFLKIYDITAQLVKRNISDLWILHTAPTVYTRACHKCLPGETISSKILRSAGTRKLFLSPSEKSALKPVKTTVQVFGSFFWKLKTLTIKPADKSSKVHRSLNCI